MTDAARLPACFGVAGIVWAGAVFAADPDLIRPEVTPLAGAVILYVIVAFALILFRHKHLSVTLGVLWVFAVVLTTSVITTTTSGPDAWIAIPAGILFGSLAFVAWSGTGALLCLFVKNRAID